MTTNRKPFVFKCSTWPVYNYRPKHAECHHNEIPDDFVLGSSDYEFFNKLKSQVGCTKVDIAGVRISIEGYDVEGDEIYGQGIQTLYKCTYEDGSTKTKYAPKHVCPEDGVKLDPIEFLLNENEHITKVITHSFSDVISCNVVMGWISRMTFVTNQGRQFENFKDVDYGLESSIETLSFDDSYRFVAFAGASRPFPCYSACFGNFSQLDLLYRFGCYAEAINWKRWKTYILMRKLVCNGRASQGTNLLDASKSERVIGHILSDEFPENLFHNVLTFL